MFTILADPNPDDPLVGDIARLYKRKRVEHDSKAREWTIQYASGEIVNPDKVKKSSTQMPEVVATTEI